jgi:hypothetical protein
MFIKKGNDGVLLSILFEYFLPARCYKFDPFWYKIERKEQKAHPNKVFVFCLHSFTFLAIDWLITECGEGRVKGGEGR